MHWRHGGRCVSCGDVLTVLNLASVDARLDACGKLKAPCAQRMLHGRCAAGFAAC